MITKFTYLLSYFMLSISLYSQNHNIDSLKKLSQSLSLKPTSYSNDTNLIKAYNSLSREFIYIGAYDKADSVSKQALVFEDIKILSYKVNEAIFFKRQKANTFNYLGIVQSCQGNKSNALNYFNRALKMTLELGDKKGISSSLGSMGNVFKDQGNYSRALEHFFGALKLTEELKLDNVSSIHLANIGNVYQALSENQKALTYYFKALSLAKKTDNKRSIAVDLGNIGLVYMHMNDFDKALEYYFKSLKMAEEMQLKLQTVNALGNIGDVYLKKKDFGKALEFIEKVALMVEKSGIDAWFEASPRPRRLPVICGSH